MIKDDRVYQQLRYEIDTRTTTAFPSSESALEISLLKQIFTPLEAQIAIHLSAMPEGVRRIHRRVRRNGIDISKIKLEEALDSMVIKGGIINEKLLFRNVKQKLYALCQFVVGIYEMQVDKITKKFASEAERYLEETYIHSFASTDDHKQMRTIPVNKSIPVDRYVTNYDNIIELVKRERGPFSVMECVCRQVKDKLDEPCKLSDTRRVCITLGYSAIGSLELYPSAEEVPKEEILKLLDEFQETGFVLQPENCNNPKFICVCCGCCCGALSNYRKLTNPADFWVSNYIAKVDSNLCNGCEICVTRCQMDAIVMTEGIATINLKRCFGCGNCVTKCPENAITMFQKDKITKPKKFHKGLYLNYFRKKRSIWGFLKMFGLYLLGFKV
ncbi:MAG: ATP-binding protein [Candidatus Heimdallarchaeota archaeon]